MEAYTEWMTTYLSPERALAHLQTYCQERKVPQLRLAMELGIPYATLNAWFTKRRRISALYVKYLTIIGVLKLTRKGGSHDH